VAFLLTILTRIRAKCYSAIISNLLDSFVGQSLVLLLPLVLVLVQVPVQVLLLVLADAFLCPRHLHKGQAAQPLTQTVAVTRFPQCK
jgi:hypothetical protein